MSISVNELRQVESSARMNKVTSMGVGLITILTLAETWGNWRSVAIVCVAQVVLIAFNNSICSRSSGSINRSGLGRKKIMFS